MKSIRVFRNELKFYIRPQDYEVLRRALAAVLTPDKYSTAGTYQVRSLYYDTIDDRSFYEKMFGLKYRSKFRLRIYYTDTNIVKFEIKNKIDDKTIKETAMVSRKDAESFIAGNHSVLLRYGDDTLNKIYAAFSSHLFRPVSIVTYDREAYTCDFNRIRITFDSNVRVDDDFSAFFRDRDETQRFISGSEVIMEVKFNGFLPGWIKEILSTVPATRSAISKFCMSREGVFA